MSPTLADSDGDGLSDGTEDINHNGTSTQAKQILDADTDGDGIADGVKTETRTE